MKVFVAEHEGFWPVGACSIVVAPNEVKARELLVARLKDHFLISSAKPLVDQGKEPIIFTFKEIDAATEAAHIILDGNY